MEYFYYTYRIRVPWLIFFLFLEALSLFSQPEEKKPPGNFFWLTSGVGFSSVEKQIGVNAGLSYQRNTHLISLRMTGNGHPDQRTMVDYSLLYDYCFHSSEVMFSLGSGVSYVTGWRESGGAPSESAHRIGPVVGLPLEVQLFWRFSSYIGWGLLGYANFNPESSFVGLTFSTQIGNLYRKNERYK